MKPLSVIALCVLLICSTYTFSSCCKAECMDDDIFAVDFIGFNAAEMEKIIVFRFTPDNMNSAIDSFNVTSTNIIIKDTTRVYLDNPLTSDFSFKLNVEKANLTYTINDFETRKGNCSCGPGTYKRIIAYRLNGVQYSANDKYAVEIRK